VQNTLTAPAEDGLVSVIVCVFNAGEYLRPAINSVLRQTYTSIEIVIVDDGSTDGCIATLEDLNDPRIRIFRQDNAGKPAALNHALQHARGAYYAIQDADDISHPKRIEEQVNCLRANPRLAAVFCGHELMLGAESMAPVAEEKDEAACAADIASFRMPAHDPTGMYRMRLVGHLRYDSELPIVEGLDYILRVGEMYPMRVVGKCLYSYRIHPESVTKKNPARRDCLVAAALAKARLRRGSTAPDPVGRDPISSNAKADNDIVSHFIASVVSLKRHRSPIHSMLTALRCAEMHPIDTYYYKPLAFAVVPLGFIEWYRRLKAAR
jgi:glycosyltransferase involved in cell wall biosynthesis